MILLPAIDLKDGKVVRLFQGDFATVHQVAEDPVSTARAFRAAGARWVHMVDLDGAKDGAGRNRALVQAVAREGLQVELGGGIRSMADLEEAFALGVSQAVIGSAAVRDPDFVQGAVRQYGGKIAVGVDTQDGRVRTAGWVEDSGLDYLDFARSMESLGVQTLIFTDIATDGALSGPSFARLEALQRTVSCWIIASGGVSCNEDLVRLAGMGLYGAILGKAYYTGAVDLAQAVREAGPQAG
ncbi:MAG: 1-(5-phosphoribosyl)-5-[(5-phosphoribosylamino)methylideneamino]imidazole-4-carboxamide isomerase [Lawsonibacter sp.]|nr:1-(5-phosphoribosyl)-5-[(5-phosphoribosylamino)methylideneamino]imidazole-4-carboxamide isomerase [Lawsonibacter sp.]